MYMHTNESNHLFWQMVNGGVILVGDNDVVEASGAVIPSFYKGCWCSEQTGLSQLEERHVWLL